MGVSHNERAWTTGKWVAVLMDVLDAAPHHARVRVLPHLKRLDDCFGDLLVRVVRECGACREIRPQALARLVGWK